MARIGIDFGTGNTVIALFNENVRRAQTLEIPQISTAMAYRLSGGAEQRVNVIPSLIHYASDGGTLIGDQVLSRGLAEHPDTIRWMKRGIAGRNARRKKTAQGFKSPLEAGEEFLRMMLNYASNLFSLEQDEFTFTAPTEAFEDFHDWLRKVAESVKIQRFRILDEPTAAVLGYHGAARRDDRFMVFDFGCGTLDVSVVAVDMGNVLDKKAIQLGQAGADLGGMNIDTWIADDFCARHNIPDVDRRDMEGLVYRQAEQVKIALSDASQTEAEMQVPYKVNGVRRVLQTSYRRICPDCERDRCGRHAEAHESCLGCLLVKHEFLQQTRQTMERALENAAVKAGVRKDDLTRVLVTGGTSLVPCVGGLLRGMFDGRVEYANPFDAVARGACSGTVIPILQHDYAIEAYNSAAKRYDFAPLLKVGTEYPTPADLVKLWARGTYEGQTRLGLKIFEVSRVKRRSLEESMVEADGSIKDQTRVDSDAAFICLNRDNPTFITADPPVNLARDKQRFHCTFWVDGHRRLLVTVLDNMTGKTQRKDYPVVRL